jgi:hypothetical protein
VDRVKSIECDFFAPNAVHEDYNILRHNLQDRPDEEAVIIVKDLRAGTGLMLHENVGAISLGAGRRRTEYPVLDDGPRNCYQQEAGMSKNALYATLLDRMRLPAAHPSTIDHERDALH